MTKENAMKRTQLIWVLGIVALICTWPAFSAEPVAARTMDRDISSCDWKNGTVACIQIVDGVCKMHVGYIDTFPAMFQLENDKCNGWRHGATVQAAGRSCTETLEQGASPWHVGKMVCQSGTRYVELNP
jgi:hypothetical protein